MGASNCIEMEGGGGGGGGGELTRYRIEHKILNNFKKTLKPETVIKFGKNLTSIS